MTDPRRYRVYLLRLWQAEAGGRLVWRATLEDARTGERHGFADLAQLCAFLEAHGAAWSLETLLAPQQAEDRSAGTDTLD